MATQALKPPKLHVGSAVAVLLAALAFRFLYLALAPQPPVVFDAQLYFTTGSQFGTAACDWETVCARRGPGYPVFLAALFAVLPVSAWTVRCVQAALSGLTCVSIYRVGRETGGAATGAIAGWLAACYPPFIMMSGRLLSETLGIFLLWAGLCVAVMSLGRGRFGWLMFAGAMVGSACLTRSTLLPALPFLIAAIFLSTSAIPIAKRALAACAFGLAALALLFAWNQFAAGSKPTVGSAGWRWLIHTSAAASDPQFTGWAPDHKSYASEVGQEKGLGYRAAALASLIAYHFWFPENAWREPLLFNPDVLTLLHRAILLFGLAGLGVAVVHWRRWALPLFLLMGCSAAFFKWIEVRHNLPVMPVLFIFTGLFVVSCREWMKQGRPRFELARPSEGGHSAGIAGFIPAILFAVLFGSTRYVGAEPGGRAWQMNLAHLPGAIVQEVRLREEIRSDQVALAAWLIDLQSADGKPQLEVKLDGIALTGPQSPVQRWFPPPGSTYEVFSNFRGLDLSLYRQWWYAPFAPPLLEGKTKLRVSVACAENAVAPVFLGGVYGHVRHGHAFGPLPHHWQGTSLYRWLLTDDWRIWNEYPIASLGTATSLELQARDEKDQKDGRDRLRSGYANIRLLVRLKNGVELVF
jgi:4-amino-4-deoxy-L-arabinose transferase-like glycosyltransferase